MNKIMSEIQNRKATEHRARIADLGERASVAAGAIQVALKGFLGSAGLTLLLGWALAWAYSSHVAAPYLYAAWGTFGCAGFIALLSAGTVVRLSAEHTALEEESAYEKKLLLVMESGGEE